METLLLSLSLFINGGLVYIIIQKNYHIKCLKDANEHNSITRFYEQNNNKYETNKKKRNGEKTYI